MGALLLVLLAGAATAPAGEPGALRLANILTDNLVLQRDKPARVWGWAEAGAQVTVTITEDAAKAAGALAAREDGRRPGKPRRPQPEPPAAYGVSLRYVERNAPKFQAQTRTAKAGPDGAWQADFDAMPGGFTPKYVIAQSGSQAVAIQNVLIGELWVCSGQSNMVWTNWWAKDLEAPSADFSAIRYCRLDASWYKPLEDLGAPAQWQVCSPETVEGFSAVPYAFALALHRYLKVPLGIINNSRGGTTGQAWCRRDELNAIDDEGIRRILAQYDADCANWERAAYRDQVEVDWEKAKAESRAKWQEKADAAKKAGKEPPRLKLPKKPGDARSGWSPPAGMFNAVVWPIRRLAIRGALYYQGENNQFNRWTQYEHTFPRIIPSYRKAFGEPDLPFGVITMPGWGDFEAEPEVSCVAAGYAIVRDIQTRTVKATPHSGIITIYDVGNSYIHPHWKRPVGERAARWALANVYGKEVLHTGPVYREMKKIGGKLLLYFDPDPLIRRTLKPGVVPPTWLVLPTPREGNAKLRGFLIAGQDRRWYPAEARENAKEMALEVWSDFVDDPVAVRYGWAQWPTGNAVGRGRLPTPTFRTDDWPIVKALSHDPEVRQACQEKIDELRKAAGVQALDRKIRQAVKDAGDLEQELYLGRLMRDPKRLLQSKCGRIAAALGEYETEFIVRTLKTENPAVLERLKAMRETLAQLEAEIDKLPERK